MADIIPASVLRNLSDKLYEKRKNAALEVEGIVKQLAAGNEHDKIIAVINHLKTEYTFSSQINHRKGGLIGLAAVTVGLTADAARHLESEPWFGVYTDFLLAHRAKQITDELSEFLRSGLHGLPLV